MVSPSSRAQLFSCSYITNILTCDKHSSLTDSPGKGHLLPLSKLLQHLVTVLDYINVAIYLYTSTAYTQHSGHVIKLYMDHKWYTPGSLMYSTIRKHGGLEVTSFCVAKPFHTGAYHLQYLIGTYTASDKALCEK